MQLLLLITPCPYYYDEFTIFEKGDGYLGLLRFVAKV